MTQGVVIKTFAVALKNTTTIQLLHSVSKFADAEGPPELSGRVIGFHGERTRFGPPQPVVLPDKETCGHG